MKSSIIQQYLLGLSIVFAFLLPHTSTIFLLANPLLCLCLVLTSQERVRTSIVLIPIIPIVLSVLVNIFYATPKAFLSTLTIMLYFSLFPMVGKVSVKNVYLYIVLAVVVLSQVAYRFGVSPLVRFFDTYYPMTEEYLRQMENIGSGNVFDYRMGGLYHNSNQCSRYLTMLLGLYLIVNKETEFARQLPFILISFFSFLLAGSRTGFVTATVILFFAFARQQKLSSTIKIVFGVIFLISFLLFIRQYTGTLRVLEIESGIDNSIGYKFDAFFYYLRNETSIIHLLIGHLDVSLLEIVFGMNDFGFDSEYGSLIYRFGFIGFFSIMYFWYLIHKKTDKYSQIFYVNLLWIISSTIVCSFRAFFIFMLFLSIIYSNNRKSDSIEQNKFVKNNSIKNIR